MRSGKFKRVAGEKGSITSDKSAFHSCNTYCKLTNSIRFRSQQATPWKHDPGREATSVCSRRASLMRLMYDTFPICFSDDQLRIYPLAIPSMPNISRIRRCIYHPSRTIFDCRYLHSWTSGSDQTYGVGNTSPTVLPKTYTPPLSVFEQSSFERHHRGEWYVHTWGSDLRHLVWEYLFKVFKGVYCFSRKSVMYDL